MTDSLYPLFANLRGRPVLVVGGGGVALRKIVALRSAGALVRVAAPEISAAVRALVDAKAIEYIPGEFRESWLDGVWLAVAATDDHAVNQQVSAAGEKRQLFVNVVDDAELSSYQVPSVVRRGPLQIAISSAGAAPMLARHLREKLEIQFDESLGALTLLLARQRQRIRTRLPGVTERRRWFDRLLAGPVPDLLRGGHPLRAEHELLTTLANAGTSASPGSVALVGAGPGDAGLLTLRALRVLNEADVILHDRLVSAQVLAMARRDAAFIEVGKQADHHSTSQDAIHALMLEHARAGKRVVRLKGGDPLVFGRGGEELEFLRAHGVAFEVVPGITAASACAAYAGIPLTHRDHAQSLRLITGHCRDSDDTLDWPSLAADKQTLAVYMGVAGLARLQAKLIEHGRSIDTPFAIVENGSRPGQRVIIGTLGELSARAHEHAVLSPALLILGEVAALATKLHWFGAMPLAAGGHEIVQVAA